MASWKDLRRFLKNDGWVFDSKGTGEISKGQFSRILKQQLGVSKEEFNKKLK